MNDFVLKWLLSLVVGSVWVTVSTMLAERVSGKIGGLIAGLPSTAAVSLLFIGLTQGVGAMQEASIIIPLSSGLYSFFFITYLLASRKGFVWGMISSLIVWFSLAIFASKLFIDSLFLSSVLWILLVTMSIWWVVKNISIDKEKIPEKVSKSPFWIKALLSGVVISAIVLVSKVAGPKWGGIFATFPALTISTLLIVIRSGGVEFTRLIAKNILISTTTTIGLFAILMYFAAPVLGVVMGTIVSYGLLLAISIPLYNLIFSKLKD